MELSRSFRPLWVFLVFWIASVVVDFEEIEAGVPAGKRPEIDEPRSPNLRRRKVTRSDPAADRALGKAEQIGNGAGASESRTGGHFCSSPW
jgi:hypothetical protein